MISFSKVLVISFIFFQSVPHITAGNVLFFIGHLSSYSHQFALEPLANKLADNGHNVTFISPHRTPRLHRNITYFTTNELNEGQQKVGGGFGRSAIDTRLKSDTIHTFKDVAGVFQGFLDACDRTFKGNEFQDWVQKSSAGPQFDLFIYDKTSLTECALYISYKLNIKKVISYSGIASIFPPHLDLFGIPTEASWVPTMESTYKTMGPSFFDRLHSEAVILLIHAYYTKYYLPKVEKVGIAGLKLENANAPPISDLIISEDLIFLNSHYSDTFARSLPPFIVPIGGMHLRQSVTSLPEEITSFLNGNNSDTRGNTDGFVYISFGTAIPISESTFPPKYVNIFFNAMRSMRNLKFLWKWDGKTPGNVPENALLLPWFPQDAVLAHKDIKAFVTQGGQISNSQSIFYAVPLIIMPVTADQDYTAIRTRNAGNGMELQFCDLTPNKLANAFNTILKDHSYARAATQLSNASHDRPMHPLDLAVWWTEFVLKQDDLSYLKPGSIGNPWWVTRNLDVYAFILSVLLISGLAVCFSLYYCIRRCLQQFYKSGHTLPTEPSSANLKVKLS